MPTDDLLVRPGEAADLAAVAEVHLAARQAAAPHLMPPGVHPPEEARAWVAGWDLTGQELWVAEDAGSIVGYLRLTETWLEDLYVVPSAQGRGVGRTLLELARARRPRGFCLWVFVTNAPARGLYRSAGLVDLEETDGSTNEERAPDVRMAWPGEDPLGFFRGLIDEVDDELGRLLARRAALTAAVQPVRRGGRDPRREAEIADRVAHHAPALGRDRVATILDTVIAQSLDAAGHPAGPETGPHPG